MKTLISFLCSVWGWLTVLAVLAGASYLYFQFQQDGNRQVRVDMIKPQPAEFVLVNIGNVDVAGGVAQLSPSKTGIYREVLVKAGDQVSEGQLLAIQDDREEQISLRNAEIALEDAEISYEQNLLDREIQERDVERARIQREQDAIPEQELENQLDNLKKSDLTLVTQKNAVEQARANLETAQFNLEQRKLRSPVDGKVIQVDISAGKGVSTENVSTAIYIVPNTNKVVRVSVAADDLDKVFQGQDVIVQSNINRVEQYPGKVEQIALVYSSVLENLGNQQQTGRQFGNSNNTVEVVVNINDAPLRLGEEVMVQFKPGSNASAPQDKVE